MSAILGQVSIALIQSKYKVGPSLAFGAHFVFIANSQSAA